MTCTLLHEEGHHVKSHSNLDKCERSLVLQAKASQSTDPKEKRGSSRAFLLTIKLPHFGSLNDRTERYIFLRELT